ncbi:uncharacterized protein C8orf88 homolog [Diretmus argenteus]
MEVSRRRILQKHLEPARPLRRCNNLIDQGKEFAQPWRTIGIEEFLKIVQLQKQKEGRICYTRDFLIGLASSPVAKRKPEFLPDHPIVLSKAGGMKEFGQALVLL